ncbi:hypothetical protein EVA_12260 [gut metagenome]|uniref:Uncharacterized protein n=1 Tax=gut metagenome TaxID=749906 RepID=J9CHW2_9ZZZZ
MEISRQLLPPDTEEGDVLVLNNEQWMLDKEATIQRRNQMNDRLRRLGLL